MNQTHNRRAKLSVVTLLILLFSSCAGQTATMSSRTIYEPFSEITSEEISSEDDFHLDTTTARIYPNRLTFQTGEDFYIYLTFSNFKKEKEGKLEISLWLKDIDHGKDWELVMPYRPLSMARETDTEELMRGYLGGLVQATQYQINSSGRYGLQINILDNETAEEKMIWLGEVTVHDYDAAGNRTMLLRDIVSQYPEVGNFETLYDRVGTDLGLALLYMIYKEDVTLYIQQVEQLLGVSGQLSGQQFLLDEGQDTGVQVVDMAAETLLYSKREIAIDAVSHPALAEILRQVSDEDPVLQLVSLLTHCVYSHYDYANVLAASAVYDLRSPTAHCLYFARDMYAFLSTWGYPVRWQNVYAENQTAVHSLDEVQIDSQWVTVDATTGAVYKKDIRSLISIPTDPDYILPQIRNMAYLIGEDFWETRVENMILMDSTDSFLGTDTQGLAA